MKKSLVCLALSAAFLATPNVNATQKIDLSSTPNYLAQSRANQNISATLSQQLKLSSDYSFAEKMSKKDLRGNTHTRYQQLYKGIPVWGQQVITHSTQTGDTRLTGQILSQVESDLGNQLTPQVSNSDIISNAKALTSQKFGELSTIVKESAELVVYLDKRFGKAHLAYHVEILANKTGGEQIRHMFILDANNGRVLDHWNALMHIEATGPGGNDKTGEYAFGTDFPALQATQDEVDDTICYMENENVRAVNLNHSWDNTDNTAFQFTCSENTYKAINGAFSPINDAFYFGNVTFEMYSEWYQDAPLPFQLSMKVHYGTDFENATWNGQAMSFGDGATTFYPLVDINVAVHEVSHGFTQFNSNLIYSNESGGMNEAFSDIAGEAGEYFMKGEVDWLVGADIFKSEGGLRYFEDPTLDTRSIGHFDDYYEGMDVHFSSGIYNRAYYLLSNKDGWNPRTAFDVFVLANQAYWMPDSTMASGACGLIQSAFDLDYNWLDVYDALATVGVECTGNSIDEDADGMSDISELVIGFDSENADDATEDFDNDGISNRAELNAGFDPKNRDSDNDGLSDDEEYLTTGTLVMNADTDGDQMDDGWEVANGLSPLNNVDAAQDADEDGYSNLQEYIDGTDPKDADSFKIPGVNYQSGYGIEDGLAIPGTEQYPGTNGNFVPTDAHASSGSYSLGSEDISDNQWAAMEWIIDAEEGNLTFDMKASTEANWDYFVVYVDLLVVYSVSGELDWQQVSIPLTAGQHSVIFSYEKDGSVSNGDDTVWIDNLTYGGLSFDDDGDTMLNSYETFYGLDPADPADADGDVDNDGLTNVEEFLARTNPNESDSDGDALTDFAEIDGGVTNPLLADTDGDLISDGLEVDLGLNPADAADGELDLDGDGIKNSTEAKYGAELDNAGSMPELAVYNVENFITGQISDNWNTAYIKTWGIETDSNNHRVLTAEPISNSMQAQIDYIDVFEAGVATFRLNINSEADKDELQIWVDGVLDTESSYSGIVNDEVSVELTRGEHIISFVYNKNSVSSSKVDRVALESFMFVAPDVDSDNDGLSNGEELTIGTDLMNPDTDGDGLTDGDEASGGTDPKLADTDGDGVSDKLDLYPLDETRSADSGGGSFFFILFGLIGLAATRKRLLK